MHFEGEFSVPGKPQDVMRRFADVPRMARCMPGAVLEPQAEDGSWPGAMVVTFGPKKINFKGRVTTDFDFDALTGSLYGRGTADMRAARIGVRVTFTLRNDARAPTPRTVVGIVSDAELGGVLADFARTGGTTVANVIMEDFAKRAAAEFAQDEMPITDPSAVGGSPSPRNGPSASSSQQSASSPQPLPPAPLVAHLVLWAVIKAQLTRLGRWLGLMR
jgi:carbon monoxide dehydrogenase subunit G